MVDFNKFRPSTGQVAPNDPIEIFRRLPKSPQINDLYASQAQVLDSWYKRRDERDLVIKLHTGGGKTLVGLLIAQSILNETKLPVVYLAATTQLVKQSFDKATEYSIPAVTYERGKPLQEEFLSAKKILICTYQALFNGFSRFGIRGKANIVQLGGIILDDAHVALTAVREAFTLTIKRDDNLEVYENLTIRFRGDFKSIGKLGTFDDVIKDMDFTVLEVPYWAWLDKWEQVHQYIRSTFGDGLPIQWPLLRDVFPYCHCLISHNAFVITPIYPLVDAIPSFSGCNRRVFMSATIGDDSAIIHTFDANKNSVSKPITTNSLAGVSERMILVPELMNFASENAFPVFRRIAEWSAKEQTMGTVVLAPSRAASKLWEQVGEVAWPADQVPSYVEKLQTGASTGPITFVNRYDGIDLPGNACRLLILSGLPRGSSEYDLYQAQIFEGGSILNNNLAQRIEQGIGRGARGAGDYCVVLLYGADVVSWIGSANNLKFLTSSTDAQLEIGTLISKDISSVDQLMATIHQCFARDKNWITLHAETLAEISEQTTLDVASLELVSNARKAFYLFTSNQNDLAIEQLVSYVQANANLDDMSAGWLLQFAAWIARFADKKELSLRLHLQAYGKNRNLSRPLSALTYEHVIQPGKQAEAIAANIERFQYRKAVLAKFDDVTSRFTATASAAQFEQSLEDLGYILGFAAERPEKIYGIGPDVLWLLDNDYALVIEAKHRKKPKNVLTKAEQGQLLASVEWFKEQYPDLKGVPVCVHPNLLASKSMVVGEAKALTLEKLDELVAQTRKLMTELTSATIEEDQLVMRCEQLLMSSALTASDIIVSYLQPFTNIVQSDE